MPYNMFQRHQYFHKEIGVQYLIISTHGFPHFHDLAASFGIRLSLRFLIRNRGCSYNDIVAR